MAGWGPKPCPSVSNGWVNGWVRGGRGQLVLVPVADPEPEGEGAGPLLLVVALACVGGWMGLIGEG